MKLKKAQNISGYQFLFVFENGERKEADIESLVSKYVSKDEIDTTYVDEEWGCLEFKNGSVGIEPKTLYTFVKGV
jgi:hypothetical protein